MAITSIPIGSELVVRVQNDAGTGYLARRYQDVKPNASDADVYDVANGPNGLARLQNRALISVIRSNDYEIQDS